MSPLEVADGGGGSSGGGGSDSGTRLSLPPIDDNQPPHLRPRWLEDKNAAFFFFQHSAWFFLGVFFGFSLPILSYSESQTLPSVFQQSIILPAKGTNITYYGVAFPLFMAQYITYHNFLRAKVSLITPYNVM